MLHISSPENRSTALSGSRIMHGMLSIKRESQESCELKAVILVRNIASLL